MQNPWITFNNISKPNVLQLIIIAVVIIFICQFIGWSIIITIIILIIGLYLTRSYQQIQQIDPQQEIEIKNKFIPGSNDYLKTAPNLQNIIFKLRNFVYLNKDNFSNLIFNTSHFIKYYNETMNLNVTTDYQQATTYGKEAINDLDTMIYSLDAKPDSEIILKFNELRQKFKKEIQLMTRQMATKLKIPQNVFNAPEPYSKDH